MALSKTLGELNQNISSIGEEITYTAKNLGDASVTATFETVSYTVDLINVKPKPDIILENETMNLKVGDETPAGATLEPNVGNLNYSSSDESVVIVENGIIKAVGAGEIVTFKYNGKTYKVQTDNGGYAILNLNTEVKVKKYTVTAEYKGVKVTNKVTIKNIINAKNKRVKKSKKVTKIKISLKSQRQIHRRQSHQDQIQGKNLQKGNQQ